MKIMHRLNRAAGLKNDDGFTLILALVFMFTMTIIGISVILNMTSDMFIARNEKDAKVAFQIAEAGIQDAMSRIHLPKDNTNYRGESDAESVDPRDETLSWNFDFDDVSVGYGVADMNYSVTIEYLLEDNVELFCDDNEVTPNVGAGGNPASCSNTDPEVVMFGQDFNIDSTISYLPIGKNPVYKVTSLGTTDSGTTRTIIAYVGSTSLSLDPGYPVNTNDCIGVAGAGTSINITGGNIMQSAGCAVCEAALPGCDTKADDDVMDTYLGMPLSEIKAMADEVHYCLGATCGNAGDDIPTSGDLDSAVTDWGYFVGGVGDPALAYASYVYIDNAGGNTVNITGSITGRGALIVTGNLDIKGTVDYEGLVYVLGELRMSGGGGDLNVDGAVMAGSTVNMNGNIEVTYDPALLDDIARESRAQSLLVWKRL